MKRGGRFPIWSARRTKSSIEKRKLFFFLSLFLRYLDTRGCIGDPWLVEAKFDLEKRVWREEKKLRRKREMCVCIVYIYIYIGRVRWDGKKARGFYAISLKSGYWKSRGGGSMVRLFSQLDPLDGGTDNGFTFTAANWPTQPQGIAYRITSRYPAHPAGSFYYPNLPRLPPIATLTFTKVSWTILSFFLSLCIRWIVLSHPSICFIPDTFTCWVFLIFQQPVELNSGSFQSCPYLGIVYIYIYI